VTLEISHVTLSYSPVTLELESSDLGVKTPVALVDLS
jgi:hypothetical protein